jgi:probable phosphoglycerate mutase
MRTNLLRHAPSQYSGNYLLNGDPTVAVPLTVEAEAACVGARAHLPVGEIRTCVTSPFERCVRTAHLLVGHAASRLEDPRLSELDYGTFEGRRFLSYADWLARHGPWTPPPESGEAQATGICRMLRGLRAALSVPGPRLVVGHGVLLSVVQWALAHPHDEFRDVFLPEAPCLEPLVLPDQIFRPLVDRLIDDLECGLKTARSWRVDLGVFPVNARAGLATVATHAALNHKDEAFDA